MKKFLMALLLMVPMSTYALSVGVENDVTIGSNGSFVTVDGNAVTVGTGGISFSNSDTVRDRCRLFYIFDRWFVWWCVL